jgi:hypothetical protein
MSGQNTTILCHPVAQAHWFMERAAFLEGRCMEILAAWVWTTGDLDLKLPFGTHAYEDAMHADLCRKRVQELRPSLPTYGWEPSKLALDSLDRLSRALVQVPSTAGRLSVLYGVLKPWLLERYEEYLQNGDPILEGPTIRLLEQIVREERKQIAWGQECLHKLSEKQPSFQEEAEHWRTYGEKLLNELTVAPVSEEDAKEAPVSVEPLMLFTGQAPAIDPRIDAVRYTPGKGVSREVEIDPQNEAEVQEVMLIGIMMGEVEATDMLCRILVEYPTLPWQMRAQLARQMWDECRHAASQWRLLRAMGVDMDAFPAIAYINPFVGDEPDVFKRLIVLQRVVEGISIDHHRPRGRYFMREEEYLLVQMFDYILADEDTHIALSHWITELIGNDAEHVQELARYQAQKEQDLFEYNKWLFTIRRDLARLYLAGTGAPPAKGA